MHKKRLCIIAAGMCLAVFQKCSMGEMQIPYQTVEKAVFQNLETEKYYYRLLTEKERVVYREILQGLWDEKPEIYLHSKDGKENNRLFQFVLNDYPEIFWCDGQGSTTVYQKGKRTYSVLFPVYQYTNVEREKRSQEIEAAVEAILKKAPIDGTDHEKIVYVYETIIFNTTYQENAADNQNIYSVLVNGQSVCAGYAKATQYLLERLKVSCAYLTGTAKSPEEQEIPHAWNRVSCDGTICYVDTTWGDPVYPEEKSGSISYEYLCVSEEKLRLTHTSDGSIRKKE